MDDINNSIMVFMLIGINTILIGGVYFSIIDPNDIPRSITVLVDLKLSISNPPWSCTNSRVILF